MWQVPFFDDKIVAAEWFLLLLLFCGCAGDSDVGVKSAHIASEPPPEISDTDLAEEQARAGHVVMNSVGMVFVPIPAGSFLMGSPVSSTVHQDSELQHEVTLTKSFHLGAFSVTQEQYEHVMGANPSTTISPWYPVENVSWDDAVEYCRKLSELPEEKQAGRRYRLPTEAEWEFACRAGTTTDYSCSDDPQVLRDYAWFHDNANLQSHPVGKKLPNPWSLFDMHGNVFEWCQDVYAGYLPGPVTDPLAEETSDTRVARGGSWICPSSQLVRSASRHAFNRDTRLNYIGFRVVLVSAP